MGQPSARLADRLRPTSHFPSLSVTFRHFRHFRHFRPTSRNTDSYIVDTIHRSFHHYIKVVSTHYNLGRGWRNKMMAYQMLTTNQVRAWVGG